MHTVLIYEVIVEAGINFDFLLQPVDISQIVSTRLSAMRKLQDNPNDSEAIKTLNNVQKEVKSDE